jgi:hypothetical protein
MFTTYRQLAEIVSAAQLKGDSREKIVGLISKRRQEISMSSVQPSATGKPIDCVTLRCERFC